MPLTLTITDPHLLTEQERMAVLTFCGVRVDQRSAEKIAGARNEPRDSVREVLRQAAAGGDFAASRSVHIDTADDPSTGVIPVPPVPNATTVALDRVIADLAAGTGEQRDFSAIFGGAPAAAPSVPVPPAPYAQPKTQTVLDPQTRAPAAPAAPSPASATPAASVPPAGSSNVPAAPPNPSNALDVAGMPWDHRIHATTKTKNNDGTWRQKRGVDDKLVAEVTEQNKRLMAIPAPAPAAVPGVPPVPTATPSGMTFPELMEQVIRLITARSLTIETANGCLAPIGVTQLTQLDKRPDLIDAAWGHLRTAAGVA